MNKVFLDFDGIYSLNPPKDNLIVLTNLYNKNWSINVNKETDNRGETLEEFNQYIKNINLDTFSKLDILRHKMALFNHFFIPLSQWFITIQKLVDRNLINSNTEFVFSSYSSNGKVFLIEAEGETNGQFLYEKSFYLSYYIKKYINLNGFKNISILRNNTFKANMAFYLRGFLFLNIKFFQLLIFKSFITKREYFLNDQKNKVNLISILSRNIIQSQFIENFHKKSEFDFTVIINESSFRPFTNLKAYKKIFKSFFYAEGYIKLSQLLKEYIEVIKLYFCNDKNISKFYSIDINLQKLIPELGIKQFNYKTYAFSVLNAIAFIKKKYKVKFNKHLCFEMLHPYSFFLNKFLSESVVQIQTVDIPKLISPNYVYSDKFYFSNYTFFDSQASIYSSKLNNFDALHNIKYYGLKKKNKLKSIKIFTYFCQPIYTDDEEATILFLIKFSIKINAKFQLKLHPRSNSSIINFDGLSIIDGNISSQSVILQSDIVFTRTSAIGIDSWFLNVPIIFFVNGILKGDNVDYIPNDYTGAIKTYITVEALVNQLEIIIEDFYNHKLHNKFSVDYKMINKKLKN